MTRREFAGLSVALLPAPTKAQTGPTKAQPGLSPTDQLGVSATLMAELERDFKLFLDEAGYLEELPWDDVPPVEDVSPAFYFQAR